MGRETNHTPHFNDMVLAEKFLIFYPYSAPILFHFAGPLVFDKLVRGLYPMFGGA